MRMSEATQGLLLNPAIPGMEERALRWLNTALDLVEQGVTYMEFNGQGQQLSAQFPIPVAQMLSEASYCLIQINPKQYGYLRNNILPVFF
jgi:hypothetical protein